MAFQLNVESRSWPLREPLVRTIAARFDVINIKLEKAGVLPRRWILPTARDALALTPWLAPWAVGTAMAEHTLGVRRHRSRRWTKRSRRTRGMRHTR
jgi:uncharacterized membrane protein